MWLQIACTIKDIIKIIRHYRNSLINVRKIKHYQNGYLSPKRASVGRNLLRVINEIELFTKRTFSETTEIWLNSKPDALMLKMTTSIYWLNYCYTSTPTLISPPDISRNLRAQRVFHMGRSIDKYICVHVKNKRQINWFYTLCCFQHFFLCLCVPMWVRMKMIELIIWLTCGNHILIDNLGCPINRQSVTGFELHI